jgi:hypothetical protein
VCLVSNIQGEVPVIVDVLSAEQDTGPIRLSDEQVAATLSLA